MNLTKNQRQAVIQRGSDIIVSAGAGSGKTTVLVERFITMVLNGEADVTQILSITYTRRAAGEMRSRIRRRLTEEHQLEQLRRLDSAYISTIDAFCVRMLQENPFEACYDPNTNQLSEVDEQRLFSAAFTQCMDELVVGKVEPARTVLQLAYGRVDYDANQRDPLQSIRRALFSVMSSLRVYGFSQQHIQQWMDVLQQDASEWRRHLVDAAVYSLKNILPAAIPLVGEHPVKPYWQRLIELCTAADSVDLNELCTALTYQVRGKITHPIAIQAQERCKNWQRILSTAGDELTSKTVMLNPGILQVIDSCWTHSHQLKHAQSVQNFTDSLQRCIYLLSQHPSVRERYQKQFQCVMIDEFQDANPLQMQLLDLIAAPGRLFTVGDVQQSIYGFRHAEPTLLSDLTTENGRDGQGMVIELKDNFRSREGILRFVEQCFRPMWQQSFMPLQAARQFAPLKEPTTTLLLTEAQPSMAMQMRAYAQSIALDVKRQKSECGRDYKDFAILLRQTNNVNELEHALTEQGIPFYNTARRHYYNRAEVRDMLNAVVVVATPWEDITLASVLRSPLVGLDCATLELIARDGGAQPASTPFWNRLVNWLNHPAPHPQKALAEPFVNTVRQLQKQGDKLTPAQCMEQIAEVTQLQLKLLCRPDGKQRWLNVCKLLEIALNDQCGLLEFCDHADDMLQLAMREGEAPLLEEKANVVRILTVHSAKGLEFPVVYLADVAKKITRNPGTSPIRCIPSLQILAHDLYGESSLSQACVQWERQKSWEEELRLWYVAFTRPIDQLVMMGFPDCKGTWLELLLNAAGIPTPANCQPGRSDGIEYRHYVQEKGTSEFARADNTLQRILGWLRGELTVSDDEIHSWLK